MDLGPNWLRETVAKAKRRQKQLAAAPEMDALLARAADALNARPYNDDMVLGAEISDLLARLQQ